MRHQAACSPPHRPCDEAERQVRGQAPSASCYHTGMTWQASHHRSHIFERCLLWALVCG
jgi:hypothetical protein